MLASFIDRSYIAIWYGIQEFNPKDVFPNKKKSRIIVAAFIIDETLIQIDATDDAWLWVTVVESIHNRILGAYLSRHRNMLVDLVAKDDNRCY